MLDCFVFQVLLWCIDLHLNSKSFDKLRVASILSLLRDFWFLKSFSEVSKTWKITIYLKMGELNIVGKGVYTPPPHLF